MRDQPADQPHNLNPASPDIFALETWPENARVRLDWWLTIGGPLRRSIQNPIFVIEPRAFRNEFEREAAREILLNTERLKVALPKTFETRALFEFFEMPARPVDLRPALEPEALERWLQTYAPDFKERATKPVQAALAQLRSQLPEECEVRPWSALGYLPGLLRRTDPVTAQSLSHHWARAQAWLSPQNEQAEGEGVRMNPTAQLVRDESENQRRVWIVARVGSVLRERLISTAEAALIDELNESRATLEELAPFSDAVRELAREGFILSDVPVPRGK